MTTTQTNPNPVALHAIADQLADAVRPAMLVPTETPETSAAWQLSIALDRLSEALAATGPARRDALVDVVARAEFVISSVHEALAADHTVDELAAQGEEQRQTTFEIGEAVVNGATLAVSLPSGSSATVNIQLDVNGGRAQWTANTLIPPADPDGWTQLDIEAALRQLGAAITRHLHPVDRDEQ